MGWPSEPVNWARQAENHKLRRLADARRPLCVSHTGAVWVESGSAVFLLISCAVVYFGIFAVAGYRNGGHERLLSRGAATAFSWADPANVCEHQSACSRCIRATAGRVQSFSKEAKTIPPELAPTLEQGTKVLKC
jgi:hypothetical protein